MQSELMIHLTALIEDESEKARRESVRALVSRARGGDVRAFEEIVTRYQRQILGTAVRLLGNLDDGRDAAQEVFLRLHKYLGSFDEEREFLPWLYQMTVNICRDYARKRNQRATVSLEDERAAHNLPSDHSPEAEISAAQERKIITDALATLSERERSAIVLRDIQGLDTREVARIMGTSETTVRSQISMARLKIKKYRDAILHR